MSTDKYYCYFSKKKLEEFTTEEAIEVDVYCNGQFYLKSCAKSYKDQDDNYVIDEAIKIIASKRKKNMKMKK